jgi:hypothetical protein
VTTDLIVADVSEFQTTVNAAAYVAGGYPVIICRVYNGYRADLEMPGRMATLRATAGLLGIGWYCYLPADVDPATCARAFAGLIGTLRANEWCILDLEVGAGSQARAQQFFAVVDPFNHNTPAMLYSGNSFLSTQLGGSAQWPGRPIWDASYETDEPNQPHSLWQFTNGTYNSIPYQRVNFPGIGYCDGSVHHGTAADFLSGVLGAPVAVATPPPPAPPTPAPTIGTPITYPEDIVSTQIPGSVTLDASGSGYVPVPLPAGKSKDDVVSIRIDWASPADQTPPSSYPDDCIADVDYGSPAGEVRVIFRNGRASAFYTFRVYVA